MIAVLLQSTPPTARAMRWLPMVGLGCAVLLAGTVAGSAHGPSDVVLLVSTAALAAGVVAALHDPAAVMLAASPTSAMRRGGLRLLLVGIPVLALWWGVAGLTSGADAAGLGRLLALTSAGLVVAVSVRPHPRAVLLGASAPLVWFALDHVAVLDGLPAEAAGWWRTDPWVVVAAALLVCASRRAS